MSTILKFKEYVTTPVSFLYFPKSRLCFLPFLHLIFAVTPIMYFTTLKTVSDIVIRQISPKLEETKLIEH